MTIEELQQIETVFEADGYKKYTTCKTSMRTSHEWMKTVGGNDDEGVIVSFRVWDFEKYRAGEGYNIDVLLVYSKDYKRFDLQISNEDVRIKKTEDIAIDFKNFIDIHHDI